MAKKIEATNDKIASFYFNPETGFSNIHTLYDRLIDAGYKIKFSDLKKWYENQQVNQIYKKPPKIKSYNPIISHYNEIGELQADLMDFKRLSRYNSGYKYLLNVIDIYSRYAWVFPIKNKMPSEIAPLLEIIFKTIPKNNYKSIRFDNGRAFMGKCNEIMNKYGFIKYLNDPEALNQHHSMAIIERFNRTILNRIKKYLAYTNTLKYDDVLDKLVANYNSTYHSTIKDYPIEIFNNNSIPYDYKQKYNTSKSNLFSSKILKGTQNI